MADFTFENHGSIYLCRPHGEEAQRHLVEHTAEDAQWFGGALVVEWRYAEGLAMSLQADGYEVD